MLTRLLALALFLILAHPAAAQAPSSLAELALRLLRELPHDDNATVSPVSLQTALAMVAAGARGTTRDQIIKGLLLGEQFESTSKSRLEEFQNDGAELLLANRLWPGQDSPLLPAFLKLCREAFQAEPKTVDYSRIEPARTTINDWVSKNTKGKIPSLLRPGDIDTSTSLVLTNALYFQAAWRNPFLRQHTETRPFSTPTGVIRVPMMRQTATLDYFENTTLQAVRLGYLDSRYSMTVLLPRPEIEWKQFRDSLLKPALFQELYSEFEYRKVELQLPRFRAESRLEAQEALRRLGIVKAFSSADLSGMSSSPSSIGKVIHNAVVEADEVGTVAAAATAVVVTRGASFPVRFIAERPFVFFISDSLQETILFIGQVTSPQVAP